MPYGVGAAGTDTLRLTATGTSGAVSDSGFYVVPVNQQLPPPPPAGTSVSIVPGGFTVAGTNQVTITIRWCMYPPDNFDIGTRVIEVNGVNKTQDFEPLQSNQAAWCGFTGQIGNEEFYTSTGTITVDQNTGPVTVVAKVWSTSGQLWMGVETYTPAGPRRGVVVTAEQQFLSAPPGPRQALFTIRNTGNALDTYNFALNPGCSGPVTSCQLPAPVNVPAAGTATATVNYTLQNSAGATGRIWLKATSTSDAATKDSSWTEVKVQLAPPVGVSIVGTAPGLNDNAWRSACVTVALTDAAASECGDLRLVHALPSVRTMGTVRTPTLLYNSQHARPKPLVVGDVRLSGSVALPDSIKACIVVGVADRGCITWPGASWGSQGSTRRIVVAGDDGPWSTGWVDYTLRIQPIGGPFQSTYTAIGRLFIVNRTTSSFGAGWWMSGLEQLVVVSSTELLWIGGDGSARRFVKTGNAWKAPNFAARDSIIQPAGAGTAYIRQTTEHARVYFDATGRHDSTVNSIRHVTKFVYTGALLTKIRVPKPSGWVDYSLLYAGGLLDSVDAPLRGTKLFRTGARVDSIRDPDLNKVRFTSGSGLNQYVVTARKDRRGNSTSFGYDLTSNRLTQATRPLGNTTLVGVAEIKGLAAPVLLDSAFTEVDGPRIDVSDRTRFWVNGYGAPVRVRNAAGYETWIRYDATWPGLADSVVDANRLGTRVLYNPTRGLPDEISVYRPLGAPGSRGRTGYKWHPSLNRLTSVRVRHSGTTDGILDSISYKSDSTVDWTQRGLQASRRVTYSYTADRLPQQVTLPVSDIITFAYDALGNLSQETSPSGFVTLAYGDAAGRDTLVVTPRGMDTEATTPAQVLLKGVRQRTVFDKMSRDTETMTIGPQVTLPNGRVVPADTIRVRSIFDPESNRLSATRGYTKKLDASQGGIFEMSPSLWEYDALNRVFKQSDAGSGPTILTLDPAGNPTQTLTPRGHTIVADYDALNRVTRRIVPQDTVASSSCHYPLGVSCGYSFPIIEGPTLCIAVDTARFSYDPVGNLRRAENNWAKVRRGYFPNGLLKHDTLTIRRYETDAPGPCGGGDKHALAEATVDWNRDYVLQYNYDLAGRRTSLSHPTALDPCSGTCGQTYTYETALLVGTLSSLAHPNVSGSNLTTLFGYDDQLRHTTTTHPGNKISSRTYDPDGRVLTRTGPVTTPTPTETLSYDATGRVIGGSAYVAATGQTLALSLGYSGLGALQWSQGVTTGLNNEEFKTDAFGNRLWVRDPDMVDGIDRTKYMQIEASTGQLTEIELGTAQCAPPGVPQPSCHPQWYAYEQFQSHDPAGNVTETWGKDTRGTSGTAEQVPEESRSYYSADQKLMYYNRHLGWSTPGEGTGTFDEYRYDALGRRVLSRSRRPQPGCLFPCEAYVQRTIWDGDQVLYEVRSSGQTGTDPVTMDTDGQGSVATGDDPNLYGIVAYAHAHGIDQPVGILKKIPNGSWAYVTPYTSWRGEWSYGTFANGNLCLAFGATCPNWPGATQTADGSSQGTAPPTYTVWWGSLLRDRADASGLQYLRNRYYDPKTGRFTQQDPIGLGGGMNLYGFADGDPVNFSDPFGLCIPWPACALAAGRVGAGVGTLVGAGVGALGGGVGALPGAAIGNRVGWVVGVAGATIGAIYLAAKIDDSWEGLSEEELKGKSAEEVDEAVPGDWTREPSRTGGTRYRHPTNRGEQIRVQPGKPTDPNPAKQGPYCRISRCGETSDPIPLKGNPTLPLP
jgi:RHS repeat-associated protein